MTLDQIPAEIRHLYEIHEWKHACAILQSDFPDEWKDIIEVLTKFRLYRSWLTKGGGRKSKVSGFIDDFLYQKGWEEKDFATQVVVDEQTMETPTHKIDCYKNRIALEVEWNQKNAISD